MIDDEVLSFFSGKNVVVTGGTGMIGRQIVLLLCEAGANVRAVSLDQITVHEKVEHIYGDLTDPQVCLNIAKDMDFVFHVAGIKGSIEVTKSKPASFFVPLLLLNTNVLEAARKNKVRKLVYTSSIGAYSSAEDLREDQDDGGPPMDLFPGWAKRMAELQLQAYRIQYDLEDFSTVRLCNVYGPGDNFDFNNAMVIPSLMCRISNGENPVVVWGDGTAVRDFAFSRDVAEGIILALHHGTRGEFVNLGSGKGVTIRELVEALRQFLDFNYEFDTSKPSGFPRRVMDINRAQEWIGYKPSTSLIDGLRETWNWFWANKEEFLKKQNYFKGT